MDDTNVEEDLARIANPRKLPDGIIEFVVVVSSQGRNPSLDLLDLGSARFTLGAQRRGTATYWFQRHGYRCKAIDAAKSM